MEFSLSPFAKKIPGTQLILIITYYLSTTFCIQDLLL
jgi:hypothetical protein